MHRAGAASRVRLRSPQWEGVVASFPGRTRGSARNPTLRCRLLRLPLGLVLIGGEIESQFRTGALAASKALIVPNLELNNMGESFAEQTEPRLRDLLGEPIVHLVMQADNVDAHKLRTLLELTAARIRNLGDVPRLANESAGDKSSRSDDGYRLGVGIMLLNNRGKIFVGQRIDVKEEAWQMPQGGIGEGETPREAALRELREEIGAAEVEIVAETKTWYRYDLPPEFLDGSRHGGWPGQQQKWFLMLFRGRDSDINVATDNPEFSQWRWVTTDRLIDLIVPFKRELYLRVLQEFTEMTPEQLTA
jgi:putative (di)nucleoside polyphosphate hydrolase